MLKKAILLSNIIINFGEQLIKNFKTFLLTNNKKVLLLFIFHWHSYCKLNCNHVDFIV